MKAPDQTEDNEWFLPAADPPDGLPGASSSLACPTPHEPAVVEGARPGPALGGSRVASTASRENSFAKPVSDDSSLLVIGPSSDRCVLSQALQQTLDESGVNEAFIPFESDAAVERFVDESTWNDTLRKVEATRSELNVKAACLVHDMPSTSTTTKTIKDKTVRTSLALLLRLIAIAGMLIQSGLPYVLISSWPDGEEINIAEMKDFAVLGSPARSCFAAEGRVHQVVSNMPDAVNHNTMGEVLGFIAFSLIHSTALNSSSRPVDGNDHNEEQNMMRPEVRENLRLGQNDSRAARHRENKAAIGGMKDPRKSLRMIPGHVPVGRAVAKILEDFVSERPHVHAAVHRAIGDSTKKFTGPTESDVAEARHRVEDHFGITESGKEGLTQLNQEIYAAWIRVADDPDYFVANWLRYGTPLGMVLSPEHAGIFPPCHDQVPEHLRRPLQMASEDFVNYSSIEDSEHGEQVLQ